MSKYKVYHLKMSRKGLLYRLNVRKGDASKKQIMNIQHKDSDVVSISPDIDHTDIIQIQ